MTVGRFGARGFKDINPNGCLAGYGHTLECLCRRQREFSLEAFGPHPRIGGVLDHISKEVEEARANPGDVSEWADLVLLALDGGMRAGHSPEDMAQAVFDKLAKNKSRTWPDWRTVPQDKAIEHVRGDE